MFLLGSVWCPHKPPALLSKSYEWCVPHSGWFADLPEAAELTYTQSVSDFLYQRLLGVVNRAIIKLREKLTIIASNKFDYLYDMGVPAVIKEQDAACFQ